MSHYRVVEANGDYINIGRMGDNLATMVKFDVSDITELYGSDGEFTLLARIKGTENIYPVAIEIDMESNNVSWFPTSSDTSSGKTIQLELVYSVGEQVVYNKIYTAIFGDSFANEKRGDAPEATWINQVVKIASEVQHSVSEAEGFSVEASASVQRANEYATSASTSAQNASASASSASQAKTDAEKAKADAVSAKNSAEESASLAQQYADSVDMATVAETIQYLGIGG